MEPTLVILNPWAGKGSAGARRPALEAALQAAGLAYTLVTSHARGGATELAWQGVERGAAQIIAVGGDGTINEVVNGIKGAEQASGRRVPLGIVAIGTGSDFVKTLEAAEASDLASAIQRIAAGTTRTIDLGRVQVGDQPPRFFVNGLGMGLDAQIAVEAEQIKNLKGIAVYFLAIIRALAKYKAGQMTIQYDDQRIKRRLLFASVANGRYQGGGFYLTPAAQLDDGQLDFCFVDNLRLDEIMRYLPRVLEGTHVTMKQATLGSARRLTVESSSPIPVATDGEVLATDARMVQVEVVPAALDVLTNARETR
ncbi:MAG: diacylglycerol kinase family lipid kinase [Roseiflexaceae bacterium]|nr:diacylglycerol kinase family lipid kinase [Roseiflexaceae bacterium]